MSELLILLLRMNLAAAVGVLVVLALRRPARRLFGPRMAYGLWTLVPAASVALLLPGRVETIVVRAPGVAAVGGGAASGVGVAPAAGLDLWPLLFTLWLIGAGASLAALAWRQARFGRAERAGRAGPAVVGVLRPRVVTPIDFERRYTPREQAVILAHERGHIARHDARINALVATARALNWFNPMVHLLAQALRLDQELACDAWVVARHPGERRTYAEAMFKTQLAIAPPPLGCHWLGAPAHPLAERVRLLALPAPGPARRGLGAATIGLLGASALAAAWSAQPPELQFVLLPTPPAPAPVPPAAAPAPPPAGPRRAVRVKAPEAAPLVVAAAVEAVSDASPADTLAEPAPPTAEEPAVAPRRIYAAANMSSVEPGSAVRVLARTHDPEGHAVMTDLTSFGSQHFYRTGTYLASGSRQRLFTSVIQRGERLWVTASLNRAFRGPAVGTIEMRSGETRDLVLGNGQVVTVTPTLRPETSEEAAGDRESLRRAGARLDASGRALWAAYRNGRRAEAANAL
jgi:beta-lactamase regulating signal transducer with metallopeptidase domain